MRPKKKVRSSTCLYALLFLLTVLIAGCGTASPTPTVAVAPTPTQAGPGATADPFQGEWNALIDSARREGQLNIMAGGSATRQLRPIADHFQQLFGINVVISTGSSADNVDRVLAERQAGRYTEDIAFAGGRSGERLVAAGALAPVEPLLIHPEVTDLSRWYGARYWWSDVEEQYMFVFAADVTNPPGSISYNVGAVNPDEITSMWDVLDSKYSVVAAPPTHASGQTTYFQLYMHQEIGPEWVRAFVTSQNVTFTTDTRFAVDGLAQGRFDLAVLGPNVEAEIAALQSQGVNLPVQELRKELREAGFLVGTGSSRNIEVMDRAPHPSAAKLFLNWFLTVEGQTAMQTLADGAPSHSLRVEDLPQGLVPSESMREPGREYPFPSADPALIAQIAPTVDQIIQIWQQR